MTIRRFLEQSCVDRGMSEIDAMKVVSTMISHPDTSKAMLDRWDDEITGYPGQLMAVLSHSLEQFAIRYIEENRPQAWYKSMFENK